MEYKKLDIKEEDRRPIEETIKLLQENDNKAYLVDIPQKNQTNYLRKMTGKHKHPYRYYYNMTCTNYDYQNLDPENKDCLEFTLEGKGYRSKRGINFPHYLIMTHEDLIKYMPQIDIIVGTREPSEFLFLNEKDAKDFFMLFDMHYINLLRQHHYRKEKIQRIHPEQYNDLLKGINYQKRDYYKRHHVKFMMENK